MSDGPKELRPHGHVYGNFKPTRTERERVKKTHKSAQQRRDGNDAKYLSLIRQLPCVVCLKSPPSDPHHLKGGQAGAERAFGRRATDRWAIPICRKDHDFVQPLPGAKELQQFKDWGIDDIRELACCLYSGPRELDAMKRIILAHRR